MWNLASIKWQKDFNEIIAYIIETSDIVPYADYPEQSVSRAIRLIKSLVTSFHTFSRLWISNCSN